MSDYVYKIVFNLDYDNPNVYCNLAACVYVIEAINTIKYHFALVFWCTLTMAGYRRVRIAYSLFSLMPNSVSIFAWTNYSS